MLNKIAVACILAVGILSISPLHAKIFKWKGEDGKWHFSDVQPISAIDVEQVRYRQSSANAVDKKEPIAADATKQEAQEGGVKADDLTDTEKQNLAIRQQNCQSAKANLTTYRVGGRIRRANKKGEMVFLSDTEVIKYTKQAEADVAKFCS